MEARTIMSYSLAPRLALIVAFCGLAAAAPAHAQQIITGDAARTRAVQLGIPVRSATETRVIEINSFVNGVPRYLSTSNTVAADTISTDECRPGGSTGYNLTGTGIRLGIWDAAAVRATHVEFGGRATQRDGVTTLHNHATHVAGTMIAAGISPAARGMAPAAFLDCYDWNSDVTEMRTAAGLGLRVSNHSYGLLNGWALLPAGNTTAWYWFGDTTISATEDYKFGFYTSGPPNSFCAREYDRAAFDFPNYLIVKSAGNDRNEGPSGAVTHYVWNSSWVVSSAPRPNDGGTTGFDTLDSVSTAKNIITVGAVNDLVGGYNPQAPQNVQVTSFSAFGPTDDGRIKPDIVANGSTLTSPIATTNNAYAAYSGTSMAAPSVSGSLGLLVQRRAATGQPPLSAAALKAVVIHTADECGNPGPDYRYGWGLMNTKKAAQLITQDATTTRTIIEGVINNGQTITHPIHMPGGTIYKVTLCWTDPAGPSLAPSLDPTTAILVNNLDLRVANCQPYILNPSTPSANATFGDNNRDNVEQVVVDMRGLARDWYQSCEQIRITHKGVLSGGSQRYALIISHAGDCPTAGGGTQ